MRRPARWALPAAHEVVSAVVRHFAVRATDLALAVPPIDRPSCSLLRPIEDSQTRGRAWYKLTATLLAAASRLGVSAVLDTLAHTFEYRAKEATGEFNTVAARG